MQTLRAIEGGLNKKNILYDQHGMPIDIQKFKERQYAAAKVTRLTGDWIPANQDINTLIRNSTSIIRARSRQLVRDFPYFNRAINNLTNYTVGNGITFQSRVTDSEGKFDKKSIQQIEDAIEWAYEELDVAGKLHGHELERLSKRQDVENGELIFVKTILNDPKRYIPYSLQPYEADWLTSAYSKVAQGNEIDQGIEYDPNTGRNIAYHFAVPSGFGTTSIKGYSKSQRIPAEYVIHNFHTLRPGQLRGISPFTTAILIAHDLGDYLDAEIDGAKMAAKYLGFVKTSDIGGFQKLRTTADPEEDGKKLEDIENAIIEYLRPGEEINIAQHNRPGNSFEAFTKFCLRMVAVATDTPYELLSGDYDGISYSNLRGIRNDFAVMMRPHQTRHITHVTQVIVRDCIQWAALAKKINLPGYFKNPRHYQRGAYTAPGMESIDMLRESKAFIEQIQACLISPQEIVAKRGKDFEDVLDEIQEAKKLMEEKGIPYDKIFSISTSMAQNPAALIAADTTKKNEEVKVKRDEMGEILGEVLKTQIGIQKNALETQVALTRAITERKEQPINVNIESAPMDINIKLEQAAKITEKK